MENIKITINGNEIEIFENTTIKQLLDFRNVTGTMFVVEKNLEIVPKDQYDKIIVQENDKYEIVGFFGGG